MMIGTNRVPSNHRLMYLSPCVFVHDVSADEFEELYEITYWAHDELDDEDDDCQYLAAALKLIGPWAQWATPLDTVTDMVNGATSILLAPTPKDGLIHPQWTHGVTVYADDQDMINTLTDYLIEGWVGDATGVVIATAEHRRMLHAELTSRQLNEVSGARRLVVLDAAETLSKFMVDGVPDPTLFHSTVGAMVRDAIALGPLRAFGEMVGLLWEAGNVVAALQLECLWTGLQNEETFSLLCGYHADNIDEAGLRSIRDAHDHNTHDTSN